MRLTEQNPRWLSTGGEGVTRDGKPMPHRSRIGMTFNCPCGAEGERVAIYFENPPDGGPAVGEPAWHREGDDFETMTLSPSLQRADPGGCNWHGYLRAGSFEPC